MWDVLYILHRWARISNEEVRRSTYRPATTRLYYRYQQSQVHWSHRTCRPRSVDHSRALRPAWPQSQRTAGISHLADRVTRGSDSRVWLCVAQVCPVWRRIDSMGRFAVTTASAIGQALSHSIMMILMVTINIRDHTDHFRDLSHLARRVSTVHQTPCQAHAVHVLLRFA